MWSFKKGEPKEVGPEGLTYCWKQGGVICYRNNYPLHISEVLYYEKQIGLPFLWEKAGKIIFRYDSAVAIVPFVPKEEK